jgi:hypothetical protein
MFAQAKYEFAEGQSVAYATHGDDSSLFVEFRMESVVDHAKSREEGRTIHHDVPYIKIMFPGDKTKVIDRPARLDDDGSQVPPDNLRFPRQWAKFKANEEQIPDGLPITEWPPISKSQALDLRALGIQTVEQLTELPDTALTWLGSRELREQARAWLDKAGSMAATAKLATTNARLQEQIDALQKQIKELGAVQEEKRNKKAA